MSGPYDEFIDQMAEPEKPEREKVDVERVYRELSEGLDQDQKNSFDYLWDYSARKNQLPPPGVWRVWMIMAGRGFGKTRAGAEWVRMIADSHPDARIALVSSSLAEARAVIFLGSAAENTVRTRALDGTLDDYELSFEDGAKLRGKFLVQRLDYAGDFNGERSYTLQLESSGPVVAA